MLVVCSDQKVSQLPASGYSWAVRAVDSMGRAGKALSKLILGRGGGARVQFKLSCDAADAFVDVAMTIGVFAHQRLRRRDSGPRSSLA